MFPFVVTVHSVYDRETIPLSFVVTDDSSVRVVMSLRSAALAIP